MISVTASQMDALADARLAKFKQRLLGHLQTVAPSISDTKLRQTVDRAISEGRQYGFTSEQQIASVAEAACSQGGFPDGPLPRRARAILLTQAQAAVRTGTPQAFGNGSPSAPVQSCPLKDAQLPKHWIEIELLGDDGKPVPWEEYTVKLPDGKLALGFLDGDGFARFESLEAAGMCEVRFPNLDKDAWEKIETTCARDAAH